MRIVFVLTYPIHHSIADRSEWLRWRNRDRTMPALLAAAGVDVELWGVGREAFDTRSELDDPSYPIRIFAATRGARTRDQASDAMAIAAGRDAADLFVMIGTNGGVGYHLYDTVLSPLARRYAIVIGGDYWSRIVPDACFLFTESAMQERALSRPGARFWRTAIAQTRMERLPKTIAIDSFRPDSAADKRWDVIALSRLTRWKRFDEVGALSRRHRVAVIGGGPRADALAMRFPNVDWLGHVAHRDIPALLNQGRIYFHAGRRDYFPRAIAEAMACGLPVVALRNRIGADVVPGATGILTNRTGYGDAVTRLLKDEVHCAAMGAAARAHVLAHHGPLSSAGACETLIRLAK